MKFGLTDRELTAIISTLQKMANQIEKAVIFGSRARGDYKNTSDIDLAVYAPNMTSTELNLLRDALDQLNLIYKFDLIDVHRLTKAPLLENIETEGQIIFMQNKNA